MKYVRTILTALFISNIAMAQQVPDENNFECVEVVIDPTRASCEAVTVSCMGGFLLQVNEVTVDEFPSSTLAQSLCLEAKVLAKDVSKNRNLVQNVFMNEYMVTETLKALK